MCVCVLFFYLLYMTRVYKCFCPPLSSFTANIARQNGDTQGGVCPTKKQHLLSVKRSCNCRSSTGGCGLS